MVEIDVRLDALVPDLVMVDFQEYKIKFEELEFVKTIGKGGKKKILIFYQYISFLLLDNLLLLFYVYLLLSGFGDVFQ